jgi:hypothetical protein
MFGGQRLGAGKNGERARLQHHRAAIALCRCQLGCRRGLRHDDRTGDTFDAGCPCQCLRVVAGRCGDQTMITFSLAQRRNFVQDAAWFE